MCSIKGKRTFGQATHEHIIRFAPPLVITEEQLMEAVEIIKDTIINFK
jgi:ornithine--oxo-acid transaminase